VTATEDERRGRGMTDGLQATGTDGGNNDDGGHSDGAQDGHWSRDP